MVLRRRFIFFFFYLSFFDVVDDSEERPISDDGGAITSSTGIYQIMSCLNFASPARTFSTFCFISRATGTVETDGFMRWWTKPCVKSWDSGSFHILLLSNLWGSLVKKAFTAAFSITSNRDVQIFPCVANERFRKVRRPHSSIRHRIDLLASLFMFDECFTIPRHTSL